jgi:Fic family protein
MISRCNNDKNESYQYYGEKGIKVCDRWLESFENFLQDMGDKPTKNHSIDRINVNGNYEPSNCRWADKIEQENNKTTNVLIEYQSKKYTISELARLLNINYDTLRNRTVKKNIFTYE